MVARLAVAQRGLILPGQVRPLLPSQFVVPNGLVGYWGLSPDCLDFNQGLAFDISGNGNHGTLNNLPAAAALANGPVGGALTFNGTSAYVKSASPYLGTTNWTILGWFLATSLPQFAIIAYNGNDSGGYGFGIGTSTGASSSNLIGLFGGVTWLTTGYALSAGIYYHVAFTKSPSSILCYVDAVNLNAGFSPSTPNAVVNSFTIGMELSTTNIPQRFFNGVIGEFRFYNRALDPWEIQALSQAGLAGRRDAILRPQLSDLTAAGMYYQTPVLRNKLREYLRR